MVMASLGESNGILDSKNMSLEHVLALFTLTGIHHA